MNKNILIIGLLYWVTLSVSSVWADKLAMISEDGNYAFIPEIRLQLQHQVIDKEEGADSSGFLLRRGRVKFDGHVIRPELEYEVEFDLGTPDSGDPQFDLKDFYLNYRWHKFLHIKPTFTT